MALAACIIWSTLLSLSPPPSPSPYCCGTGHARHFIIIAAAIVVLPWHWPGVSAGVSVTPVVVMVVLQHTCAGAGVVIAGGGGGGGRITACVQR